MTAPVQIIQKYILENLRHVQIKLRSPFPILCGPFPSTLQCLCQKAMKAMKAMKVKVAALASMDPVVSLFYRHEARWEARDGDKEAKKAKKAEQKRRASEREWKATKMKKTMVAHAMSVMAMKGQAKAMKAIPMKVMKAMKHATAPASAMKAMKSTMKVKKVMKQQRPRLLSMQPADQKMLHAQQEERRQRRSGRRKAGDNSAPLLFTRKNVGYWPCVSAGRHTQCVIPLRNATLCAPLRQARLTHCFLQKAKRLQRTVRNLQRNAERKRCAEVAKVIAAHLKDHTVAWNGGPKELDDILAQCRVRVRVVS